MLHLDSRVHLYDFLMASLCGTISFSQMHDVAILVGYDLNLDMARVLNALLYEDLSLAEVFDGLVGVRQTRLL